MSDKTIKLVKVWDGYRGKEVDAKTTCIDLITSDPKDPIIRINLRVMRLQLVDQDGDILSETPFTAEDLLELIRNGMPWIRKGIPWIPANIIDLNNGRNNMYGIQPCPRCHGENRWPSRPKHPKHPSSIICDECGFVEPIGKDITNE